MSRCAYGGAGRRHLADLRGLLARSSLIPIRPPDYEQAAALHRACRRKGETARKLVDCLTAAVAIRSTVPVLQSDNDFLVLARHTSLELHGP